MYTSRILCSWMLCLALASIPSIGVASSSGVFLISNVASSPSIVDSWSDAWNRVYLLKSQYPAPKPISYSGTAAASRLGCNYSDQSVFVVCLRTDGTVDQYELDRMLDRIRDGWTVKVGSKRAEQFVVRRLSEFLPYYHDYPVQIVDFHDCRGACGLRVEVSGG